LRVRPRTGRPGGRTSLSCKRRHRRVHAGSDKRCAFRTGRERRRERPVRGFARAWIHRGAGADFRLAPCYACAIVAVDARRRHKFERDGAGGAGRREDSRARNASGRGNCGGDCNARDKPVDASAGSRDPGRRRGIGERRGDQRGSAARFGFNHRGTAAASGTNACGGPEPDATEPRRVEPAPAAKRVGAAGRRPVTGIRGMVCHS